MKWGEKTLGQKVFHELGAYNQAGHEAFEELQRTIDNEAHTAQTILDLVQDALRSNRKIDHEMLARWIDMATDNLWNIRHQFVAEDEE